jgi:hypothetical protein
VAYRPYGYGVGLGGYRPRVAHYSHARIPIVRNGKTCAPRPIPLVGWRLPFEAKEAAFEAAFFLRNCHAGAEFRLFLIQTHEAQQPAPTLTDLPGGNFPPIHKRSPKRDRRFATDEGCQIPARRD